MDRPRVSMISMTRMAWGTLCTLRILWVLIAHVGTLAFVHDGDLSRSWRPWSLLLLLLLLCLHLKELPLLLSRLHLQVLGLPHLEHAHLVMEGLEDALIGLLRCILPILVEPVLGLVEVLLDLLEGLLLLQLVSLGHDCRPVLVQLLLQHVLGLLPGHLLRVLLLHLLLLLPQLGHHLEGKPPREVSVKRSSTIDPSAELSPM